MPYAQRSYSQIIGRDTGHNYRISQVGCLLTAQANLLERFNIAVDPLTLNNFYVDHGIYVDAPPKDNILDDLDWNSVCQYDQNINYVVGNGAPTNNDSIVKFVYGPNKDKVHFSLVVDAAKGAIVDSYDGQIKSWDVYGGPKSHAYYVYNKPAPVQVDPITVKPEYKYERFERPIRVRVKPNQNVWDLGSFIGGYAGAVSLGVCSTDQSGPTDFTAVGKATKLDFDEHPVYYMSGESFGDADITGSPVHNQGVNTADLEPAPEAAPAVPVVEPVAAPVEDNHIIVKVNPPNPEAWKASYKTNNSGDYVATTSLVIKDLEGKLPDVQLVEHSKKKIAGDFTGPDGVEYWRTFVSASRVNPKTYAPKEEDWRGIPKYIDGKETMKEDESAFDFLVDEAAEFASGIKSASRRSNAIRKAAIAHGDMSGFLARFKIKRGK